MTSKNSKTEVYIPQKKKGSAGVDWVKSTPKPEPKSLMKKTVSMSKQTPSIMKSIQLPDNKEAKKKKADKLKKEMKKCSEEVEKGLVEAASVNNAVETVQTNYRDSKNFIKVRLCSNSTEYINAQQLENAQLSNLSERIKNSEEERQQMQTELERALKFIEEYDDISTKSWYTRFIRWIY